MRTAFLVLPLCYVAYSIFTTLAYAQTSIKNDHTEHNHTVSNTTLPVHNTVKPSTSLVPVSSVFVCPMHPTIVRDTEGTCPICGMALVKKTVQTSHTQYPSVMIESSVQQNMGLRLATVETGSMWQYIDTLGRVAYDEEAAYHVHPRTTGWINTLNIRYEGQQVTKGDVLYEVYSPEIVAAQKDLLLAMKQSGTDRTRMVTSAEDRLRLMNVHPATIKQIKHSQKSMLNIPFHAPASGVVLSLTVKDGMYIKPEVEMFSIVDLSNVWVFADVYIDQISWFTQHDAAVLRLDSYPHKKWAGKVDYIYPKINIENNTATVRLVFSNKKGLLVPNMFGNIEIFGGPRSQVLIIPEEAVIPFHHGFRVIKQLENDTFLPVDIEVGMRRKGYIEVVSGLTAGDTIVSSGQFLIDSESQLNASFLRLSTTSPEGHTPSKHAH